jgi:hypothetical protein
VCRPATSSIPTGPSPLPSRGRPLSCACSSRPSMSSRSPPATAVAVARVAAARRRHAAAARLATVVAASHRLAHHSARVLAPAGLIRVSPCVASSCLLYAALSPAMQSIRCPAVAIVVTTASLPRSVWCVCERGARRRVCAVSVPAIRRATPRVWCCGSWITRTAIGPSWGRGWWGSGGGGLDRKGVCCVCACVCVLLVCVPFKRSPQLSL